MPSMVMSRRARKRVFGMPAISSERKTDQRERKFQKISRSSIESFCQLKIDENSGAQRENWVELDPKIVRWYLPEFVHYRPVWALRRRVYGENSSYNLIPATKWDFSHLAVFEDSFCKMQHVIF